MKRLRYAGGSFLTGDAEADAILRYAAALANLNRAETLTVIARGEDGTVSEFELLIGPASQIVAEPADVGSAGLPAAETFVADVDARIKALSWRPAQQDGYLDEFDL